MKSFYRPNEMLILVKRNLYGDCEKMIYQPNDNSATIEEIIFWLKYHSVCHEICKSHYYQKVPFKNFIK